MPSYVLYASEDEGFRFPIGKPKDSMKKAMKSAERYMRKHVWGGTMPSVIIPTEEQALNSGPPVCHGKVVKMFCLDGDEYINKLDEGPTVAYAYDWLYIIKQ